MSQFFLEFLMRHQGNFFNDSSFATLCIFSGSSGQLYTVACGPLFRLLSRNWASSNKLLGANMCVNVKSLLQNSCNKPGQMPLAADACCCPSDAQSLSLSNRFSTKKKMHRIIQTFKTFKKNTTSLFLRRISQCLKNTKNCLIRVFNFGIFHLFLSY